MYLKKGFTLMEVIVVLSIISILSSIVTLSYRYYVNIAKDQCASSSGQEIFEAVVWSYEAKNNVIDSDCIKDDIKDLTGYEVTITSANVSTKTINLIFLSDSRTYEITADLVTNRFRIKDIEQRRFIYEY
jgi:prepilin-type N-terminal cleavage/methylation domain-containing protein